MNPSPDLPARTPDPRRDIPRIPWPIALVLAIAWAFACSAALSGCAAPPSHVYAPAGELREAAAVAVPAWADALREVGCGDFHPTLTSDPDAAQVTLAWEPIAEDADDVADGTMVYGQGMRHGWRYGDTGAGEVGGIVNVDPACPPERLGVVVAHELGHTFGASHSDSEVDLMWPHYFDGHAERPTSYDARSACAWWPR